MAVLSIVDTQLSLQKQEIAKVPQKHRNVKKLAADYAPTEVRKLHWWYGYDPVDSQR